MTRFFFASAVALCLVASFNQPAMDQAPRRDLPRFVTEKKITCAVFAEAINHYVDMGEENAIAALKAAADATAKIDGDHHRRYRIAFICRVLFEPKGRSPLREPAFGGLSLPTNTMPLETWPLYPVVRVGSSHFLLSEGYSIEGRAERCISYVEYCCSEGKFRKNRVPVPTRAQALQDFGLLSKSEPWKSLKWRDKGPGFEYLLSESLALQFIEAQADRIPKK